MASLSESGAGTIEQMMGWTPEELTGWWHEFAALAKARRS